MKGIEITFRRLLEKFKFTADIPKDVQKYALSVQKPFFIHILKEKGHYSFFTGRAVTLFFTARKLGVRLTLSQSMAAFILIMTIMAGAVSALGIYSAGIIKDETPILEKKAVRPVQEKKDVPVKKDTVPDKKALDKKKRKLAKQPDRIGIVSFKFSGVEKETAGKISRLFFNKLRAMAGKNRVVYSGRGKAVKRKLMGRVSRLGEKTIIEARVVDVERGDVLFNKVKVIKKDEEIERAVKDLSTSIYKDKRLW